MKLWFQDVGNGQAAKKYLRLLLHLSEVLVRLAWSLFRLRRRYELVHAINVASWFSLLTVPIAKALGKPVILEMVSLGADDPLTLNSRARNPDGQLFPHRPLKYTLFRLADAYVSKSPALSAACFEAGLPESGLFQIPSPVDVELFKPVAAREKRALRQKLGFSENETLLLFVGGTEAMKGFGELLTAFREVAGHNPRAHLAVVGPTSDPELPAVEALHRRLVTDGLSTRVTLVGRVTGNMHEYMQASDVFVHPSKREGLSVAVLEAMATGLASVASDIPAIADSQIQHGVEGLLVPVGDVAELAAALTCLVEDVSLRQRLGAAARQRVIREFTGELVYQQYLDLYRTLVQRPQAGD